MTLPATATKIYPDDTPGLRLHNGGRDMKLEEIQVGQTVWYLYRAPGEWMTRQQKVEVLGKSSCRVKILRQFRYRPCWVKPVNLRLSN